MMLPTKPFYTCALLSIAVISATGCQHARSFLHMDSNSPAPFLGLELSVDAKDSQTKTDQNPIQTASLESTKSDQNVSNAPSQRQPDPQFVTTSESGEHSGNLKFTLPALEIKAGSNEAEEVDAIMSRFPGS